MSAAQQATRPFFDVIGAEITTLSAHLNAANYRLLALIAQFDYLKGWTGWASCAHWLNWACGMNLRAARERVRVARALVHCPSIREALKKGEVSFSQVRAMTRVADAKNEVYLLNIARHATAAHLEKVVRHYRRVIRDQATDRALSQFDRRSLSYYHDEDNTLVINVRLPTEEGQVVLNAIEQFMDEADDPELSTGGPAEPPHVDNLDESAEDEDGVSLPEHDPKPKISERRADSLYRLAQHSLESAHSPSENTETDAETSNHSQKNQYQVVVHVDEATLRHGEAGLCEQEDGPELANETVERLCCDADILEVTEDEDGEALNVGRKRRSMPKALARALRIRDQGCRFPGCTHKKWLEGHHIKHWAKGGETKLKNMIQLCRFHHRLLHEGKCDVKRVGPNKFRFFDPYGRVIPNALPAMPGSIESLLKPKFHSHIDRRTCANFWDGKAPNYGDIVEHLEIMGGHRRSWATGST